MDIPYQRLGVRLFLGTIFWPLRRAGESSLVVETVEICAGVFEFLYPFLGFRDHHVAVKGSAAVVLGGLVDVFADLGDDRSAECDVGNEMSVP